MLFNLVNSIILAFCCDRAGYFSYAKFRHAKQLSVQFFLFSEATSSYIHYDTLCVYHKKLFVCDM